MAERGFTFAVVLVLAVGVAGSWRVATEWWNDVSCLRDYYDLELSGGGIYRCFRDRRSGTWYVDGTYD